MIVVDNPRAGMGEVVGNGHCMRLLQLLHGLPHSSQLRQGAHVRGTVGLPVGTVIATFGPSGRYENKTDGSSHIAILLEKTLSGLLVVDQWQGQPVHKRLIYWRIGNARPVNDANAFYVVETATTALQETPTVMPYPVKASVLDLSHWNTITDWSLVAGAGIVGAIHKFTQGVHYQDPTYAVRAIGARKAGLLWGRYHFGDASDVDAQVAAFLKGWQSGELLALDWEDNPSSQMTLAQAQDFVQAVEDETGVVPVLYTGNRAKDVMKGHADPVLARCRLWLAHYAPQPVCPPGWDRPWLWQYAQTGRCAGIPGHVDVDAFNGTPAELAAQWAGAPTASS